MNEALFTGYSALPAWTALFDRLPDTPCLSLVGMTEGEKSFFAAALAHTAKRPGDAYFPHRAHSQAAGARRAAARYSRRRAAQPGRAIQPRGLQPGKHVAAAAGIAGCDPRAGAGTVHIRRKRRWTAVRTQRRSKARLFGFQRAAVSRRAH